MPVDYLDLRSQGIGKHGIDTQSQNIPSAASGLRSHLAPITIFLSMNTKTKVYRVHTSLMLSWTIC